MVLVYYEILKIKEIERLKKTTTFETLYLLEPTTAHYPIKLYYKCLTHTTSRKELFVLPGADPRVLVVAAISA